MSILSTHSYESGLQQQYFLSYRQMQVFKANFQAEYGQAGLQSSVLRIQSLEMALQRAIEDISLLQKNLTFVIGIKEQLQSELKARQRREEAIMKEYQREVVKRDTEIQCLKNERQQIAELLTDTQESLNAREASALQRDEEKRRLERIIQDQRSTMQSLQEQLLAAKYSSDLSYQSISFDNIKIQQLEKEIDMLQYELGKNKTALEKESLRVRKLEKQVEGFKGWLGGVLGVRKVVQGCEGVLMQEIESRMGTSSKY